MGKGIHRQRNLGALLAPALPPPPPPCSKFPPGPGPTALELVSGMKEGVKGMEEDVSRRRNACLGFLIVPWFSYLQYRPRAKAESNELSMLRTEPR